MITLLDEIFDTVKNFVYNGPLNPKPVMLLFTDDGRMYSGTYLKDKEGNEFGYVGCMPPDRLIGLYNEIRETVNG